MSKCKDITSVAAVYLLKQKMNQRSVLLEASLWISMENSLAVLLMQRLLSCFVRDCLRRSKAEVHGKIISDALDVIN